MHIKTFGVEMWMNEFENHCRYNLAETCVDSITLGELIDMAGVDNSVLASMNMVRKAGAGLAQSMRPMDFGKLEQQTKNVSLYQAT